MAKKENAKIIPVNLKFHFSKRVPGKLVSYVTRRNSSWRGVNETDEYHKKVVVIGVQVKNVIEGVLYNAMLIPMIEKDGFVAIKVTPVQFEPKMETLFHKSGDYYVKITFGNKVMVYDPKVSNPVSSDVSLFKKRLCNRVDIKNLNRFIEDFDTVVNTLSVYQKKHDRLD